MYGGGGGKAQDGDFRAVQSERTNAASHLGAVPEARFWHGSFPSGGLR